MNKEEILDWARKLGYKGDFKGIDVYCESIGMCLIYDPEDNRYYTEPWNG